MKMKGLNLTSAKKMVIPIALLIQFCLLGRLREMERKRRNRGGERE